MFTEQEITKKKNSPDETRHFKSAPLQDEMWLSDRNTKTQNTFVIKKTAAVLIKIFLSNWKKHKNITEDDQKAGHQDCVLKWCVFIYT